MYRYIAPVSGSDRIVAYRELASGHDCRLQSPLTLYSFRQKFWFLVVLFKNKLWLAFYLYTCGLYSLSSLSVLVVLYVCGRRKFFLCADRDRDRNLLELIGAELLVDNLPNNLVGRHLAKVFSRWIDVSPLRFNLVLLGRKGKREVLLGRQGDDFCRRKKVAAVIGHVGSTGLLIDKDGPSIHSKHFEC